MATVKILPAILCAAAKAGLTIRTDANGTSIIRWSAHKQPRMLAGVRVWGTGWAQDLTVDLSCSKHFRPTEANLRAMLKIS
jgi:hypothetical protein